MIVIKDSHDGYSRLKVVRENDEEIAELFVFEINHPKKKDSYILLEDFKVFIDIPEEEKSKLGILILGEMYEIEKLKSEDERIDLVKLGSFFQKVRRTQRFLGKDLSSEDTLSLKDFTFYD